MKLKGPLFSQQAQKTLGGMLEYSKRKEKYCRAGEDILVNHGLAFILESYFQRLGYRESE